MKTSVVPAQVTSKEDTITGNLTLTQLILLVIPIFVSVGVFIVVPPLMHMTIIKVILTVILSVPFIGLAVRLQGILVLEWIKLILSFKFRPRLYLNTLPRTISNQVEPEDAANDALRADTENSSALGLINLRPEEITRLKAGLAGKRLVLSARKGGLSAVIEAK